MEKFEKQESKTIIPLITPLLTINSSTIYALIPGVSTQKDVLHTVILCPELSVPYSIIYKPWYSFKH